MLKCSLYVLCHSKKTFIFILIDFLILYYYHYYYYYFHRIYVLACTLYRMTEINPKFIPTLHNLILKLYHTHLILPFSGKLHVPHFESAQPLNSLSIQILTFKYFCH